MDEINEYNYQAKGFKKFIFHFFIEGSEPERSIKAFDKTERGAKDQVRKYYLGNGCKIKFSNIHECD